MISNNIRVPKELEGLLNTRQAAAHCGKHQRTIVSWIHRGLVPALKLPGARGQYFVHPDDLDKVMTLLSTPIPYSPEGP